MVLAGCATFRALFQEDRPPFVPTEAAHVSGAYSRAIGIAYEDWMADRARQRAEREEYEDAGDGGGRFTPESRAANACFDRPDAYQTWVYPSDAGTSYFVVILAQDGVCFPKKEPPAYLGDRIVYEIDAKTFQVLNREVQE